MTVQKVIHKDPQKENEKYLIFLDYTLEKLRNGRSSGISLRNLASDYKSEMGTSLDRDELKEFVQLYDSIHFDKVKESIDRLIIKKEAVRILLKYGSIREYLKQQANKNYAKKLVDFEFNSFWVWTGRLGSLISILGLVLLLRPDLLNKLISITNKPIKEKTYQIKPKIVSDDSIYILKTDSLTKKLK